MLLTAVISVSGPLILIVCVVAYHASKSNAQLRRRSMSPGKSRDHSRDPWNYWYAAICLLLIVVAGLKDWPPMWAFALCALGGLVLFHMAIWFGRLRGSIAPRAHR